MKCNVTGLDDLIHDLDALADDTEEIAEEMLEAAADVMEESWRDVIKRYGLIDSGSMHDNVKSTVNTKKKRVDTYPRKKDKKGTQNAVKAFVLHHGKAGNIKATYFVNDVQEEGATKAHVSMRAVLEKHLKQKGL